MITASDVEIKTRYEDLSMSVTDIAEDMGLEQDAVRLSLTGNSAAYRNTLRRGAGEERALFNDMILKRAAATMEQLMDSPEESVRFRASKFVIDEIKGRNDAAVRGLAATQNLGIGVQALNEALRAARMSIARVREGAIDVSSKTSEQQLEMVLAK